MKVRGRRRLLLRVTAGRRGRVEQERQHAVQKTRVAIERRDVAIEREIAAAEPQRLLGRGEEGVDDAGQRLLDVGRARARQAVDRRVIPKHFVVVPRLVVQAREREQLVGGPRRVVAARLEIGERLFGGADVAGALIVVEHAGHRRQVGRARHDVGARLIEKRAKAVGAFEQVEVLPDDALVPERAERLVVHRERVRRRPTAHGEVGAPFQHPRVIGAKPRLLTGQQRFGLGHAVAIDEEAKQPIAGRRLLRISLGPCPDLRFRERVRQLLRIDEREDPLEDSPRLPLGHRQQRICGRVGRRGRHGQRVRFLLRQQTTVIEVGEHELPGGGVGRGARVCLPVGFSGCGIELLLGRVRAQRQQLPIGGGARHLRQRVVRIGRRAAHFDRTGRRRHGLKDRVVPARGGLHVPHPFRQLCAQAERTIAATPQAAYRGRRRRLCHGRDASTR